MHDKYYKVDKVTLLQINMPSKDVYWMCTIKYACRHIYKWDIYVFHFGLMGHQLRDQLLDITDNEASYRIA